MNKHRHPELNWVDVLEKLEQSPKILWSLHKMEQSGGEPDVVELEKNFTEILFIDCAKESPNGRRSLCYDQKALDKRKNINPMEAQ